MNTTIYIVEDDGDIAELIDFNLSVQGYETKVISNGDEAYDLIIEYPPDLLLLDLSLPGLSGIEIAKYIRSNPEVKDLPIIMLTARSQETDKIIGLKTGADDYITKPFSVKELTARIEAILRRTRKHYDEILTNGNLTLEIGPRIVRCNEDVVTLTPKEFEILSALIKANGNVVSRLQLVEKVWGNEDAADEHTVNVNIKRLRDKLNDCSKYIKTVHGLGYRINLQ